MAIHFSPGQYTIVFQAEVFDFKVYVMKTTVNGYRNNLFYLSNATTCPYGLRGLPSWAWQ
jgi:hypothetical protein